MHTWTQPACHLLSQSLGFWFWVCAILQGKGEENRNCLDTSEKNRMTGKAAVGISANPESKDKARRSTHYCEPWRSLDLTQRKEGRGFLATVMRCCTNWTAKPIALKIGFWSHQITLNVHFTVGWGSGASSAKQCHFLTLCLYIIYSILTHFHCLER